MIGYCRPSRAAIAIGCLLLGLGVSPADALAADTAEPWSAGEIGAEGYTGIDGLGSGSSADVLANTLLGYGLVERFSAYLSAGVHANEELSEGHVDLALGVFGTAVDTDHFDWDLFFGASAAGAGFEDVQIGPATELNLDAAPDLTAWGLYLRGGVPICSRARKHEESVAASAERETALNVGLTVGAYWTVLPAYQLLLEYDMGFEPSAAQDETVDVGGIALGNNIMLRDNIELVTQLYVDIPGADEQLALGMLVGFVASLPTPPAPPRPSAD